MKKVNVVKNNKVVQSALFAEEAKMNEWIETLSKTSSWGKDAYDEIIRNDLGEIIETIHHEAEYLVEVQDITVEVEAQKKKEETKKTDRVGRVDKLKAIDWNLVTTFNDQQKILKWLVKEAIKDDE